MPAGGFRGPQPLSAAAPEQLSPSWAGRTGPAKDKAAPTAAVARVEPLNLPRPLPVPGPGLPPPLGPQLELAT